MGGRKERKKKANAMRQGRHLGDKSRTDPRTDGQTDDAMRTANEQTSWGPTGRTDADGREEGRVGCHACRVRRRANEVGNVQRKQKRGKWRRMRSSRGRRRRPTRPTPHSAVWMVLPRSSSQSTRSGQIISFGLAGLASPPSVALLAIAVNGRHKNARQN